MRGCNDVLPWGLIKSAQSRNGTFSGAMGCSRRRKPAPRYLIFGLNCRLTVALSGKSYFSQPWRHLATSR